MIKKLKLLQEITKLSRDINNIVIINSNDIEFFDEMINISNEQKAAILLMLQHIYDIIK